MVATRRHPAGDFPDSVVSGTPIPSPSKSNHARRSAPPPAAGSTAEIRSGSRSKISSGYTHHPPSWLILWLLIALPLVLWDSLYIMLRPRTLPGGNLHSPVWSLYGIYATVDHVYGWPAWRAGSGFPAAQMTMNLVETALYGYYLSVVLMRKEGGLGSLVTGRRRVDAVKGAGVPVVIVFASSVMTVAKTTLYGLPRFPSFEIPPGDPFAPFPLPMVFICFPFLLVNVQKSLLK
jgi:hypothetical protein